MNRDEWNLLKSDDHAQVFLGDVYDSDPLAPARGCLLGSIIGMCMWAVIAVTAYLTWRRFA